MTQTQTARTIEEIIVAEEAARKEWEARTYEGPYTVAQLRQAFERIEDKRHWKRPFTYYGLPEADRELYVRAVIFFHGARPATGPDCERDTFFITSPGYQG